MSYNNYVDADAALRAAYDHAEPGRRDHQARQPVRHRGRRRHREAHRKAHACDPVSAYGGVIATNRPVTAELAEQVAEIFTEVVVAPAFEPEALEILTPQEEHPAAAAARGMERTADQVEFRPISGGVLMQTARSTPGRRAAATTRRAGRWRPATPADEATLADLRSPGGRSAR